MFQVSAHTQRDELQFYRDGRSDAQRGRRNNAEQYFRDWGKRAAEQYSRGYADAEREVEEIAADVGHEF